MLAAGQRHPAAGRQCSRRSRQGVAGSGRSHAAARWEVTHDVSQSGDKAWAFLTGWEGLIRAVVLISICRDCSTGIIRLGITAFNQGGRKTGSLKESNRCFDCVFNFAFNSFRLVRHVVALLVCLNFELLFEL